MQYSCDTETNQHGQVVPHCFPISRLFKQSAVLSILCPCCSDIHAGVLAVRQSKSQPSRTSVKRVRSRFQTTIRAYHVAVVAMVTQSTLGNYPKASCGRKCKCMTRVDRSRLVQRGNHEEAALSYYPPPRSRGFSLSPSPRNLRILYFL